MVTKTFLNGNLKIIQDCLISDGIGSKISIMHMNAGIVQIYGYISDLSSATSIQLGLSKLKPVSSYVIIPFYNHQQPYTMIGSLWIKSTGEVTIYKPSNITQGYISGTFISE